MTTQRHPAIPAQEPLRPLLPERVVVDDLVVRMWRPSDVDAMGAAIAANLEHLRPFMDWIAHEPATREERLARVAGWRAERDAGGGAVYGILRGERVVGGTGLHRRVAPDGLEIGYWLAAAEQGHGTMSAVVAALTRVALAHPMITHVEIHMDEANVRSAAVAERCSYELVERYQREAGAPAETGVGLRWLRTAPSS